MQRGSTSSTSFIAWCVSLITQCPLRAAQADFPTRSPPSQNFVRKALYPEHYNDTDRHLAHATSSIPPQTPGDLSEPFDHLDHCINNVREALMCNADLTPVVVQWDPATHWHYAHLDVVHTCKDWDAIQRWAVDHAMAQEADLSKHVE